MYGVTTRTPESTISYENLVKVEYERQVGDVKFSDDETIKARIIAYYGIPKSASKKKKEAMKNDFLQPAKKPDIDNVVKIILDSLNGIAYKDDTQVVSLEVLKKYSENPRTEVHLMNFGKKA
jgi:Holliday junction resolvase RusA-like endonuclease